MLHNDDVLVDGGLLMSMTTMSIILVDRFAFEQMTMLTTNSSVVKVMKVKLVNPNPMIELLLLEKINVDLVEIENVLIVMMTTKNQHPKYSKNRIQMKTMKKILSHSKARTVARNIDERC